MLLAKAGTARHHLTLYWFCLSFNIENCVRKRHYFRNYSIGIYIGMRTNNIGVKGDSELGSLALWVRPFSIYRYPGFYFSWLLQLALKHGVRSALVGRIL